MRRDEQILGTAEYFAPEQSVNSQTVDGRADIYGLGCTLYFLLTGHPPFRGRTALELMNAHHQQVPASVLVDRPDAPPALLAICQKMMEKSPLKRYQSCSEVALALDRWLESERAAGRGREERTSSLDSAATRDTQPNLRETAKLDRAAARPATSSDVISPRHDVGHDVSRPLDSDVLLFPPPPSGPPTPPPPAPPIVSPPRAAQSGPIPTVVPIAAASREPAHASLGGAGVASVRRSPSDSFQRASSTSGATGWLVTCILSALVVGAILLALFAFSG